MMRTRKSRSLAVKVFIALAWLWSLWAWYYYIGESGLWTVYFIATAMGLVGGACYVVQMWIDRGES